MLDTGQLQLSGDALIWFRQGLAAAAVEAYDRAIAHYDRVIELRPDFYEVWYERGLSLEKCGYYIEAIASFDRALSLRPRMDAVSQIWYDRGNAFQYGLGDYVEAIACYDRVLNNNSSHELSWQNRGNALLYGLSRPEEAIACYNRVLHINPDNYLAWRNRGNALVELRRHTEAIASYDRALTINPDDEVSWHARNLASERSGLNYRQPTTNPAWYGAGFNEPPTFVEGETDTNVTFSSDLSCIRETGLPTPNQPILIVEDDSGWREITLDQQQYLIGRDPQNEICLRSQFASRHHAVLSKVNKPDGRVTYQITDGNLDGKPSTNGLLINGQKYRTWELQADDVVVFGPRVRATFRMIPARSSGPV